MRQPQDGDERLEGVAKDRLDAAALCLRMDRYKRGKKRSAWSGFLTADEDREQLTANGFPVYWEQ